MLPHDLPLALSPRRLQSVVRGVLASSVLLFTDPSIAGQVFYVDGAAINAGDDNPGTEARPWKTIQKAAKTVQAGDTVYIKAATYTGDVSVANSGTTNGWITFSAYPGQEQKAVLDHGGFYINQKSYIQVTGLRVQHSSGWGIGVTGPGGNYVISSNYVYDIENSGIAVWGIAYRQDPGRFNFKAVTNVLVANNTIEQACNGGYDEQLDIANGVDSFEVRSNILKNGINATHGGEGIDCKEGASNGRIWGNELFNLERWAIYLEAGNATPDYYKSPGMLTNIAVFNNRLHHNRAHAIGVTTEGLGNIDGLRIFNNVCYSNAGDGILVYHHPWGKGYIQNVTIVNNTVYANGSVNPPYGGIATDHESARNVLVRNNIVFGNVSFQIKGWPNPSVTADHNLTTDPHFVNAAQADFHLRSDSLAIGFGAPELAPPLDFDFAKRPRSGAIDVGAFKFRRN